MTANDKTANDKAVSMRKPTKRTSNFVESPISYKGVLERVCGRIRATTVLVNSTLQTNITPRESR